MKCSAKSGKPFTYLCSTRKNRDLRVPGWEILTGGGGGGFLIDEDGSILLSDARMERTANAQSLFAVNVSDYGYRLDPTSDIGWRIILSGTSEGQINATEVDLLFTSSQQFDITFLRQTETVIYLEVPSVYLNDMKAILETKADVSITGTIDPQQPNSNVGDFIFGGQGKAKITTRNTLPGVKKESM